MRASSACIVTMTLWVSLFVLTTVALAADTSGPDSLRGIRQQIKAIKTHQSAEQRRVEQDENTIRTLEQQLQRLESENVALKNQSKALVVTNDKLRVDTTQQIQDIQEDRK